MELSRINEKWVRINFSDDFSWQKVNAVKKIPGREYKPDTENWHVPLNTRENATKFLSFCNNHGVEKLPDQIENMIKELREKFREEEKREKTNRKLATGTKPFELEKVYGTARGMELREYQKAAVEYIEKNKRAIIGDHQGLGKTISAIGAVQHLDAYPVLCVVPAAVRSHWEKEWNTWVPRRAVKTIKSGKHTDFRGSINIVTYSLVYKFIDKFKEKDFEALICDESHKLKNNSAKRSKAVRKISKGIPYRMLLTGTPSINQPSDIINQLKILGVFKDTFGGWMQFTDRYCDRKDSQFGQWDISGASNLDELFDRLTGNCYVRRNKDQEGILDELPAKQRSVVELDIDNRKKYENVEENLADHLREKYKNDEEFQNQIDHLSKPLKEAHKERHAEAKVRKAMNAEHLVKINELRQVTSQGKYKEAKKWIRNFIGSGEPLLLFAHYTDTTEALAEEFNCPKITGSVDADRRGEIVEEFQNGKHDLLVLNIEAGGVGITLTEASNVAFVEIPWTWAETTQAEDRVHRMGQKKAVNVYYLLANDTIDEWMWELINKKKAITDVVNKGMPSEEVEQKTIEAGIAEKVMNKYDI
jgi:SWI/SNF-related matrix-associated actin-dependent regulator 1 of chromatin subfamily A